MVHHSASPASMWVAAALRWRLAPAGAHTVPEVPDIDSVDLVRAVSGHRVVGWLAPVAAELGLEAATRELLDDLHRYGVQRSLVLVATTRSVSATLADAGIDHLVVKGAALAHLQGVAPAVRGGGDVDVWVAPDTARAGVAVLEAAGWTLRHPEPPPRLPSPHWRDRCYSWITPETGLVRSGSSSVVDLHWRLMRSPSDLALGFDDAWGRSVAVPEVGANVRTLCVVDALRHVAAHGTKDGWTTLRHVADVVLLARRVDRSERAALAARDRTVALALAVAGRLAPDVAPPSPPSCRRTRLAAVAWDQCLDQRLRPERRPATAELWAVPPRVALVAWQVRSAPNPAAALHPIAEAMLPARAILDPAPLPKALVADLRRQVATIWGSRHRPVDVG